MRKPSGLQEQFENYPVSFAEPREARCFGRFIERFCSCLRDGMVLFIVNSMGDIFRVYLMPRLLSRGIYHDEDSSIGIVYQNKHPEILLAQTCCLASREYSMSFFRHGLFNSYPQIYLMRIPLRRFPGSVCLDSTLLTRALRNNVSQPRLYVSNIGSFTYSYQEEPYC